MIYDSLIAYSDKGIYPYHMPGHKRKIFGNQLDTIYKIDITEIDGFDNLHDANGLIAKSQQRLSMQFGAKNSYFLVNGSTSGILSAISAAVPKRGKILLARNSHKAAYHSIYLRELEVSYLYPRCDSNGIFCGISADEVQCSLMNEPDIQAVFITSPTYEGRVSDIEGIVKVVQKFNIPLIVDEAHGAHFGFHPSWPKNSNFYGADIVVQSIHKTLPSLTQTAVIHTNGTLIDENILKKYLQIYQSSSPSYVFMASIEQAIHMISDKKISLFQQFKERWEKLLIKISDCNNIKVVETDDLGKLVLSVENTNISGQQLYEILLNKYKLQLELSAVTYVIAIFTIADTPEGFERMADAILEIDSTLSYLPNNVLVETMVKERENSLSLATAWEMTKEFSIIEECLGKRSGEFINLYPPGIPILVPGEIITAQDIELIQCYREKGLEIQGVSEQDNMCGVTIIKSNL